MPIGFFSLQHRISQVFIRLQMAEAALPSGSTSLRSAASSGRGRGACESAVR